jgi:Lrp/AsnC family transcriptional regulator for asnA, asnC and gidA
MARNGSRESGFPVDDTSKAIIEQLQADGRRAYATIGKAVGLSEAAVRQRVQKLIDHGVVQIVAVTAVGDIEAVAEQLAKIDEVDYLVITAGSFDLMAEVVVENDEHLLQLVNQRIRTIPGVTRTESFLYLRLAKQTYNWGAR